MDHYPDDHALPPDPSHRFETWLYWQLEDHKWRAALFGALGIALGYAIWMAFFFILSLGIWAIVVAAGVAVVALAICQSIDY